MADSREDINHWQEFFGTLKDRLREPCKHPTFVMYFIVIIIIIGGFGVLEPIVSYLLMGSLTADEFPRALTSAVYTYFVAIAATAAVDLILSYQQRKFLLMFFILCGLVVVLCFFFAVILGTYRRSSIVIIPSIIGYTLALFLWWIGNATNANLLDIPPQPTAPAGGDANARPSGDLSGFRT
jgi:hypothetical protein